MAMNVEERYSRDKRRIAITVVVLTVIIAIVGAGIFFTVKTENEEAKFDSFSFFLGKVLVDNSMVVRYLEQNGEISDRELRKYNWMEEELFNYDQVPHEKYISCIEYVAELSGSMELVRIILSSVKEDIPINALPLSQGFLIGSSQFMIEGLKDSGQISDREYGKILKRYMELMDKPTDRKSVV